MKKLTNEEFINRLKLLYGDKYDYSKVNYTGRKKPVKLICPIHGEFENIPDHLLIGISCQKCGYEKATNKNKSTLDEFIKKAKEVHGDKYDYSKVEYINNKHKICIICPEHGEFWQRPCDHINSKQGCPLCGQIKSKLANLNTTEGFIEKAIKIHGDKYDYSKVEYINEKEKVEIYCKKCQTYFFQTPQNHLHGHGCQNCNSSHLENEIRGWLQSLKIEYCEQKKFDWLGQQSLDFYIPSYNLAIECQGKQHFMPVEIFGGNQEYLNVIERDNRKKNLCEEHNVKMLYFSNLNIEYPYKVFENKEELLKEILQNDS